jgi:hypothetical protein
MKTHPKLEGQKLTLVKKKTKNKMKEHSRRRKERTEARAREQKRNQMPVGSWSQGEHTQSGATGSMVDSPNLLPLKNYYFF